MTDIPVILVMFSLPKRVKTGNLGHNVILSSLLKLSILKTQRGKSKFPQTLYFL